MSEKRSGSTRSKTEGSQTKPPQVSAATVDAIVGHITKPASPPMDPYAPNAPQPESRPSISAPSQAIAAEPDEPGSMYLTTLTKRQEHYYRDVSETVTDTTAVNKTPTRATCGNDDTPTADQSIENPPASPADSLFDGSPTNFKIKYHDVTEPTADKDARAASDVGGIVDKRTASKSSEDQKEIKNVEENENESKDEKLED